MSGQLSEMHDATDQAKDAAVTARETLQEMKYGGGAKDTHTLAGQAVTQATQTTKLATDTHTLAENAKAQSQAAKDLAEYSAGQLQTMQTELETAHRATIEITDTSITQGIVYNGDELQFHYRIKFKNEGTLPASNTSIYVESGFLSFNDRFASFPLEMQRKACERARNLNPDPNNSLRTVYPNDPPQQFDSFVAQKVEPSDLLTLDERPFPGRPAHKPNMFFPVIAICIDYQYLTSKRHHQTGLIYVVKGRGRGSSNGYVLFMEPIDLENVVLEPYVLGGNLSN